MLLTAFAPVLMERPLIPVEAWPILRSFANKQKVTSNMNSFFGWISAVGQLENKNLQVDLFTPANMGQVLYTRRIKISNVILGTTPVAPTPPPPATQTGSDPNANAIRLLAATIAKALPANKPTPAPKTPLSCWPHQIATL